LSLLADEFHLSQSYISKLFKDETGQNFVSYVKELRLSYVKKQLTETNLQVKDIIFETGYADVANFARLFKQELGMTPLQYRQWMRQSG
jgi:AraC-type DNA-binding domain-containing proteins